jgi:tetratricopeptide (TPR) repeat protein
VDLRLERLFDLPGAKEAAARGVAWTAAYKASTEPSGANAGDLRSYLLREWRAPLKPDLARRTKYALHLRAGLVAFLEQRLDEARKHFAGAKPFAPPREVVLASGTVPTGIERMIEVAKSGRAITPKEILDGDGRGRLMLQIADTYFVARDYEKSLGLYESVLAQLPAAVKAQRSWALYRRGRCRYLGREGEFWALARSDYLAAHELSPKSAWADDCLLLAGNILFNSGGNSAGAVALWRRLIEKDPTSEEAPRAAYYIGVALERAKRFDEARGAFAHLVTAYSGSAFSSLADRHLRRLKDPEWVRAAAEGGPQPSAEPGKRRTGRQRIPDTKTGSDEPSGTRDSGVRKYRRIIR